MEEIWKEIDWIPNLRGSYEVSNLGNVRRTSLIWHDCRTGEYKTIYKIKILSLYDNGHGYLHVSLPINTEKGRKIKVFYVHTLVATAFIENPDNKPEVNHKNFIRSDNQVSNLEWCTYEENMEHSFSMDRRLKPYYPSKGHKRENDSFEARKEKNSKFDCKNKYKGMNRTKKPLEERNIHFFNGKYTVRIGLNRKKIYVGRFEKFEDAVNARIKKLKELGLWEEK